MMKNLVSQFTTQLKEALEIGSNAQLVPCKKKLNNIVITGLGGSGIGGKIVSQIIARECTLPITINNGYDLPGFVNENTLVIASSFSGNTEETLFALEDAMQRGAEIAVISSGGKIIELAKSKAYNHIILPKGDSPRAMLTYSITQQFYLLHHYGLIGGEFAFEITETIDLLEKELEDIKKSAQKVAKQILNKTVVIYSADKFEGVAVRLRQQLNENSKVLCWHHVLPEMNHNELVGWAGGNENFAVILFENDSDHPRTAIRAQISKTIISKYTKDIIPLKSKGKTMISNQLYLILLGDWISVYLAELRNVDPIEVKVISYLKDELSKV